MMEEQGMEPRFTFGWWSTGRDEAAVELLETALQAMESGRVPGRMGYLFLSRAPGESRFGDRMAELAAGRGIEVVRLSAASFQPQLRARDRGRWREEYHRGVLELLGPFSADLVVLAGYMWVVSPEACGRLDIINLHPAAPGGPAGTWQEVIWQLMEEEAPSTGVMMHLVTPELDQGPPVTYCTFPIKGGEFDSLWEEFRRQRERLGMEGIKEEFGESQPLFARIRAEGVRRELPLIVETMRAFATGEVAIVEKRLVDRRGGALPGPYDLTPAIEAALARGSHA